MTWYCYIVECSDNSLYIGISNNISKRIVKHNSGKGSKYTRSRLPVKLVISFECKNKSDALKLEYKLKQLTRQQKLKVIYDFKNQ